MVWLFGKRRQIHPAISVIKQPISKLCDNYPDKSNLGTVYKVKFAYKSSHPSSQSLSQFLYKAQTN